MKRVPRRQKRSFGVPFGQGPALINGTTVASSVTLDSYGSGSCLEKMCSKLYITGTTANKLAIHWEIQRRVNGVSRATTRLSNRNNHAYINWLQSLTKMPASEN